MMKVSIVSIGNSRGVRLPKAVLDQCQFTDAAELTVRNGKIVLAPIATARAGWADAFSASPVELDDEDRAWLDADLADDPDHAR